MLNSTERHRMLTSCVAVHHTSYVANLSLTACKQHSYCSAGAFIAIEQLYVSRGRQLRGAGGGPQQRLWNDFLAQVKKLKTANLLWNLESTWFFNPRNVPKPHFRALPWTPLGELTPDPLSCVGACCPSPRTIPCPTLSPSGLRFQLFEPCFGEPPG